MLSSQISRLLDDLKNLKNDSVQAPPNDVVTIGINELSKKAGVFYERIRYSMDYREEHTIRRSAVERILSRNLFFSPESKVAHVLIQELIRGGYLANHSVSESRVVEVEAIIDKFLSIDKVLNEKSLSTTATRKRLLSLAATEIEFFFFDNKIDELVVNTFFETVKDRLRFSKIIRKDHDRDAQIYLACRRSLLKNDNAALAYGLWLRYIPQWKNIHQTSDIAEIGQHFVGIDKNIERQLKDRLSWRLAYRIKNYGIYFSLIREIAVNFGAETEQIFADPKLLEKEVRHLLEDKYKNQNSKTRRSALRAVIYLFLTKMVLAFFVELPYDLVFFGGIHYMPLAVNVFFHPLLLLFITATIRPLGPANTKYILVGMQNLVYGKEIKTISIVGKSEGGVLSVIFLLLYGILFLISFGVIITVLQKLDFSVVSIALFLFFLTFVSYFGLRIRYVAKSWAVTAGEERTLSFLLSLFALPIVDAGRWMSSQFSTVNVFVFIMDFIIETPFKIALGVFDSFISFLKEKREEIH